MKRWSFSGLHFDFRFVSFCSVFALQFLRFFCRAKLIRYLLLQKNLPRRKKYATRGNFLVRRIILLVVCPLIVIVYFPHARSRAHNAKIFRKTKKTNKNKTKKDDLQYCQNFRSWNQCYWLKIICFQRICLAELWGCDKLNNASKIRWKINWVQRKRKHGK